MERLTDAQRKILLRSWAFYANPAQVAPEGDWRVWLFLGGRGAGKTRAGAEWIAQGVRDNRMHRVALVAATHGEARAVMVEGASGLLKSAPEARFEPANNRVLWPEGQVATLLSADKPDSIRGHQFDGAWGDEFAKWPEPQDALDMLSMALRLGEDPRLMLSTTPRPIAALKELMARKDVTMTRSGTMDNEVHLAPGVVDALIARYGGTRLGRQELDGELIEDNENALWQRSWIERGRIHPPAPALSTVVVGVDPPASLHGDECGIVVAGRAEDRAGYVLADRSAGGLHPSQWAERVARAFADFKADYVVVETNQGGAMVREVLSRAAANLPIRAVNATRDKMTRASPASMLYEQGRVRHAGTFPELEDQLCQYDGKGPSPDRLDALVWALSELFPAMETGPRIRNA